MYHTLLQCQYICHGLAQRLLNGCLVPQVDLCVDKRRYGYSHEFQQCRIKLRGIDGQGGVKQFREHRKAQVPVKVGPRGRIRKLIPHWESIYSRILGELLHGNISTIGKNIRVPIEPHDLQFTFDVRKFGESRVTRHLCVVL